MGHVHHGQAQLLVQVLDFQLHVFTQLLVEGAQRFVHQHQFGVKHERTGQGDTLLLATRQLRGVAFCEIGEFHHVQSAADFVLFVDAVHFADRKRKGQVLLNGHVREERVVLEHHADVALVRRKVVQRLVVQVNLAMGRRFEAGQHHQAGGFARPGRAQQGDKFAFFDIEVQILDHGTYAVVGLLNIFKTDQVFHVTILT